MKKLLTMILCGVMLLSCVAFPAGAAEEQVVIPFTNCDTMSGWTGWREAMPSVDSKVFSEGSGSITLSVEGVKDATPGTALQFHYTNPSRPVDISKAEALVFDLYVANVAGVENVVFLVELNSNGSMDQDEISALLCLGDLVEGGLKEGWNTAVLPISSLTAAKGSFNAANCCFFRLSNEAATIGTAGKTTTLKLDNFRFVADASAIDTDAPSGTDVPADDGVDILLADCDAIGSFSYPAGDAAAVGSGWSGVGISRDVKEKTQGAASISASCNGLKEGAGSGTVFQFLYNTDAYVDITSKNTLAFDVYIANMAGMRDVFFEIELRSVGWTGKTGDIEERNMTAQLASFAVGDFGEGWNRIEIPLDTFSANKAFDPTRCCYFRMFNKGGNIGSQGKTTTLKLDNIHFTNVEQTGVPRSVTSCSYFADGAIYQQNKPLTVWGKAPEGTAITAVLYTASGLKLGEDSVTVGNDYEWALSLPGQPGGYATYKVELYVNGTLRTTRQEILFGELWLASGQSNMDLVLQDSYEYQDILKEADDGYLRMFAQVVNPNKYGTPQSDAQGHWVRGDKPTTLATVSAVAYSFAKMLRSELDLPVGVVAISRGSTTIESWLSKETIDSDEQLKQALVKLGVYREEPVQLTEMSAMYNGKVHPMRHLSLAGVIWYQGESNRSRGDLYERELELLHDSWGELFGFEAGKMPFVFAQVAPYAQGSTKASTFSELANLKQSMLNFYLSRAESTAMVTIYDLSLRYRDTVNPAQASVIHPTTKRPVGERMGRAALGLCYGGEEFTAPTFKSVTWKDGVATITFDHVGIGLYALNDGGELIGFALGNEDGVWVNARAEIVDLCTVKVYNEYMADACYVSYAWDDMNNVASLISYDGMPAAPFCTGGSGSFGTRPYLDCEGDVFVVTSMQGGTPTGNGAASYENVWTLLERATVAYDREYFVQGAASIAVTYTAGEGEALAGVNLGSALTYSVTEPFKGVRTVSARMANGDARDKTVRLRIVMPSAAYYTAPVTLKANADFATLDFDLTHVYRENGSLVENPTGRALNSATGFAICIDDAEGGSVWVDGILLGSDACVEPDPEDDAPKGDQADTDVPDAPSDEPSDEGSNGPTVLIVVAAVAVVAIAAVVVLVILKKKK